MAVSKEVTLEEAAEAIEQAVAAEEARQADARDCAFSTQDIAASVVKSYTVTAHHPPQVLRVGDQRAGTVTGISCTGRVACTLLDAEGKALISIDADGFDMPTDIPFAGGALSVSMKTASSITFVIEE